MRSTFSISKIFVFLAVLCPSYGAAVTVREATGASALFENFETVFYSAPEFLLGVPSALPDKDLKALSAPFAQLLIALKALGSGAEESLIGSSEGILVGAKDFAPPKHLGAVQSKLFYILLLANRGALSVPQYFNGPPATVVNHVSVWSWTMAPSEGHPTSSSVYLAQVGRSYVVITNELSEVERVSKVLQSSRETRTALPSFRRWRYLSSHSFWGYRQYGDTSKEDKIAGGLTNIAEAARTLMFTVDLSKNVGQLRLETSSSDMQTVSNLSAKTSFPPWMPVGNRLWETNISLRADDITLERLFNVMGLFGFGVYL